jgi:ribose 5-phosphate isomerase
MIARLRLWPDRRRGEARASDSKARAGIVEHGLFLGLTHLVVVSGPNGIREMTSDNPKS